MNDRLPLVIGHETTGEVYQVAGEYKYIDSEDYIRVKDHVVVIPLIPCETCSVCGGKYGKNYCPSSRFMASNHPGSLRTIYKYHSNLLLKINNPKDHEEYALFTEPMSNIVQMLQELGFIEKHHSIRDALKTLIDKETEIQGKKEFHDVSDEKHLAEIFDKASQKEGFGRLIIKNLR